MSLGSGCGRSDRTSAKRRGGCLLGLLAAWIWFGLVVALSDSAVNSPNDETGQLLLVVVILAPLVVIGWAIWRHR